MIRRIHYILSQAKPPQQMSKADHLFLRWVLISLSTLLLVGVLTLCGVTEQLEWEQIRYLGGNPFYIDAEEAQVSLLSPAALFGLCNIITFYLAIVLLRERHFSGRLRVIVPALAVLALPGMLCVLWGGVINVAPLLIAALATWLGAEISHLIHPRRV